MKLDTAGELERTIGAFLDALGVATARRSALWLDALGIRVNVSALPSVALRRAAYCRAYGSRAMRPWYRLRARFFPRRHAALVADYMQAEQAVAREFMVEVIAQAEMQLDEIVAEAVRGE